MRNPVLLILLFIMIACQGQKPERLIKGKFEGSEFIGDKEYQVYLPISYYKNLDKHYPVLYQMDGQNLFVDSLAYGGISWQYDRVADSLVTEGLINEFIIVGVNNAGIKRFSEYMPQKPAEEIPQEYRDSLIKRIEYPVFSDNFLRFIINELKPEIDNSYRVLPDVDNTYIGGSSMGGLISMYAICEYPEVFKGAICMSTHWIVSLDNSTPEVAMKIQEYFSENIPENKKFYFDYGTEFLDQYYETYQNMADSALLKAGYKEGKEFKSLKFENHNHNEYYWNKRLDIPLKFIFGKK